MYSSLQHLSLSIFIILFCVGVATASDLESAKRAYHEKDYATALKESAPLAEQGNADAQVLLGRMYLTGRGVSKDLDQAFKWLRAAAEQGNAEGQFFLGSMYLLPQKDVAEGLKWLLLAANQGEQDAQLLLGRTYIQGAKELPPDPVQGDMWLRLAAKNNLRFYQDQLEGAERQMTPDQIAKGEALATAWKPKLPQERIESVKK